MSTRLKRNLEEFIITLLFFAFLASASTCPVIFIHGQQPAAKGKAKPDSAWIDWHCARGNKPYRSSMEKILNENYGGYTAGLPLDCDLNSVLSSTGGEKRKIYNFSYYHPNGEPGVISLSEESVRVYISQGFILPAGNVLAYTIFTEPPSWGYDFSAYWPRYIPWVEYGWVTDPNGNGKYWCLHIAVPAYDNVLAPYIASWKKGKYAKRLAEFIDKVLVATGASKVDIVAHSMGGLVARVAIKNYGCDGKSQKTAETMSIKHSRLIFDEPQFFIIMFVVNKLTFEEVRDG